LFFAIKNKLPIILTIILSAFFFTQPAAFSNATKDSEADAVLEKFEKRIWSAAGLSEKDFVSVKLRLNNAIAVELANSMLPERVLFYLEKLKTIEILQIYYSTDFFRSRIDKYHDFLLHNYETSRDWGNLIKNRNDLPAIDFKNKEKNFRLQFSAAVDSAKKLDPLLVNFLFWQKPICVSEVQKKLGSREVIVDYWRGDSTLAAFFFCVDSAGVRKWHIDSNEFTGALLSFDSTLFYQDDLLDLKFDTQNAHYLYQQLISPLRKILDEHRRLTIIPDRSFRGLPFECLVSQPTESTSSSDILYKQYESMDFLIKKFSVSYDFSLSSLELSLCDLRPQAQLGRRLLTMSEPIFPAKDDSLTDALPPLLWLDHSPYVNDEIRRVSRLLFRHDNLRGEEVTVDYLKNRANGYRWIYLAQIGLLNNEQPLQSGLMMSASPGNSEDSGNWLTVNDIFQIPFRADMLTLSATSLYPRTIKNNCPGIVALPQAFLLAGNKSVLYSLWHVHSISTSEFMSKFYWELKYKRQHNTLALRGAKLASMRDTFDFLDQKVSRAHPYFWAGFRLIGSPYISSPSKAKIPPWGIVIITYFVVLIVSLIITKKTLAKK